MSTIADVWATSSSGGAGDLVLSAPSTGPFQHGSQFLDWLGSGSPAPWVDYAVLEWTDYTQRTLKQAEVGQAFISGGNTLKRSTGKLYQTYVFGTGVLPSIPNPSAPSAVSFGTVAANIRITCSPRPDGLYQLPRFRNDTNAGTTQQADLFGWPSGHTTQLNETLLTLTQNMMYYTPRYIPRSDLYSSATIYVAVGAIGAAIFGLYDDDGTGWPGGLRKDWSTTGTFNTGATGLQTVTLGTPIFVAAGWYWSAFITNSSGSPQMGREHIRFPNPGGTYLTGTFGVATKASASYGALASTGIASSGFQWSSLSTGGPTVILK